MGVRLQVRKLCFTALASLPLCSPLAGAQAGATPAYPRLELLIEPLDRIYFSASCTKKLGTLSTETAARSLHFEFPREARERGNLPGSASLVADIVREVLRAEMP